MVGTPYLPPFRQESTSERRTRGDTLPDGRWSETQDIHYECNGRVWTKVEELEVILTPVTSSALETLFLDDGNHVCTLALISLMLLNEISGNVLLSQYLDVLAGATAVADRPSPAAVTTAAAGLPVLALPPSEASGPGASNALSTPEAVANAGSERAPFDVALGGGGDGGEAGGGSGVSVGFGTKAGAAAAPASAAAPGTAWSGERASAVTTVPANRFLVGEGAVLEQVSRSTVATSEDCLENTDCGKCWFFARTFVRVHSQD